MDNIASLVCHPDTPTDAVSAIIVSGTRAPGGFITLRYHVEGDMARLVVPEPMQPARTDFLWKTTCFELFTRDAGDIAYREYNFSPSGRWAAYGFSDYREGMHDIDIWAPRIEVTVAPDALIADVTFVSPRLGPQMIAASTVIEEKGGRQSYWALRHRAGESFDFHHPYSFAYELPASDGPLPSAADYISSAENDR